MDQPISTERGKNRGEIVSRLVEWVLVLVIACLATSIAAVFVLRPVAESEIGKFRALDLVLNSPVPGRTADTCGVVVADISRGNGGSPHWQVEAQNNPADYLVSVKLAADQDPSFHWNVDLNRRTVTPVEGRTICPGK